MNWKDIVKGNYRFRPSHKNDRKDKRMSQDALFDEANRNMRRLSPINNKPKDFEDFRMRIFGMFPDYYDEEDLTKFKNSPALRNLYMHYQRTGN